MDNKELTNNQKVWIDHQVSEMISTLEVIPLPAEQYRKGHDIGNIILGKCKRQLSAYEYAKTLIIAALERIELKNRGI